MPANIGSVDVTSRQRLPFGTHHFLSPVVRSYAVIPPISLNFRIDTPPIDGLRDANACPSSFFLYPFGVASAPSSPQLSCGWLYRCSEHGSFWTSIMLMPDVGPAVCAPT